MNLRGVVIVLSIVVLVGFLTPTVIAQSKLDVFENSTHHSATSSVVIQNEYLKIEVGNNGQYRGWTAAGDAIFYPYGMYPWSSFITIKVNGSIYDNAPWSSNLDNYLTQETVKKSPVETETKWYIPEENLELAQNIILVGEQAKFILKLKNKGTTTKTVSVRYEWDTQIADNDGAPLREEGGDLHEFEIAFEPVTFSYWSAYARPQPGSLVIYATWDTTPDKIIFAHWPEAYGTLWDYSWSSSRRFYTPGYTTSPESDSCVLMYWKDISLSPGEEKSIVTYYGTTVGGGVNVDVSTDKEYYAPTENIKLSVKVTDASGNPLYPLEKENFKVFIDGNEVNIEKFKRISATDYRLEIKSPQSVGTHSIMVRADTATGWGSDTIRIKVYKISKVSLSIGGNRLTQYANSADTPIYYRGDSNVYPVFFVDVEVEEATLPDVKDYIQVSVNINDYAKVRDPVYIQANYDSGISKYKGDWKNSPNSYPVGKYNVTAEVKDLSGNLLASSQKKHFYLIFKPPSGYENYVFTDTTKYNQFDHRLWRPVLDEITGCITIDEAAKKLLLFAHGIDGSYYGYWHTMMDERKSFEEMWKEKFRYSYSDPTHKHGGYVAGGVPYSKNYAPCKSFVCPLLLCGQAYGGKSAWWDNVVDFITSDFDPEGKAEYRRPVGVCVDYSNLFVSNARSAGIPAKTVSGHCHQWAEIWNGKEWVHCEPTWYQYPQYPDYSSSSIRVLYNTPNVYANDRGWYGWCGITFLPDRYSYKVEVTIDFDSDDYDYGDWVNAKICVKNVGKFDIKRDLYLKVIDEPSLLAPGSPTVVYYENIGGLREGKSKHVSISYKLPDCEPKWLCEIGTRYLTAEIYFKGIKYKLPCFEKVEKDIKIVGDKEEIPGLCLELDSQVIVNDTPITLNTENVTSFYFNETTNESTETFDRPLNTSVTVGHKVKYYTNYTREIWYIFNPDNRTHSYGLMTPLFGIGNAVYIPGYGSVTTNQSINTDVSYIIVYNTTTRTNDSVDIYTFSRNITLRKITIFNGLVKVVGTWNTSLAQESGISYLSYSSTRNGSGMSFDEIYRDFVREIINNGDTLMQFFIEGEDGQISYYKIGDMAYISVEVINNGVLSETRNLNLVITELGPWGSEAPVYNTTKSVTVSAGDTTTVTFQYQIPDNTSIGWHGVKVSDGIARAETIFIVRAPFNVTFDIPPNVTQSEEFYVNATIKNELNITLSEINVTIDLPNDFNTSENLTKFIGTLSSGESANVSWFVTATDFEYGYAPFTLYIDSAGGIRYIASAYTNVLRLPELRIYPSAPSEVRIGVPFILRVNVTNEGDLGMNNVSIRLYLPDNVTTNDSLTKSIGDLETGEVKTIVWEITSMRDSDFWINFDGWDESRTYYDNATIFINIVKPEITLSLTTPFEVLVNQSFYIIANVKNIGEINATQVIVSLILPPEFETANNTSVTIENIASGETKELKWMLKGVNAGYGEIEVRANNASVRRGIIVSDFPLTVKTDKDVYLQGENVMINSNVSNGNPEVSYVDLRMNITIQGRGINETYSRPILYISSLGTQEISFSWDTTGKPAGNYTVTARLIEQSNSSVVLSEASTSFEIILPNQPPIANANGPYTGIEGQHVEFNASLSYDPEGANLTYYWEFGDGNRTVTTQPTITHIYAQEGNYTVTLIVNDSVQNSTPSITYALINDTEPKANFTANVTSGFAPLTVQFNDLSQSYDGITAWEWDFNGDGIIDSNEQNPIYTYDEAGNYTVSLTVYESDGDSDTETKTDYITVTSAVDTEPPTIESVTLDTYINIPNSSFHVTVEATDNVGVTSVTADGVALTKTGSRWEGDIFIPEGTPEGEYTLTITALDEAGNTAESSVNYSVVFPQGGFAVAIDPMMSSASGGDVKVYQIKIISNENFDDKIHVYISDEGIPDAYKANFSFNWTDKTIYLKSGETVELSLEVTIPQASGYRMFRVYADSMRFRTSGYCTGIVLIS